MAAVSPSPSGTAPKSNRAILLLFLTAIGAVLFTCVGSLFIFENTRRFDRSNEWVEHTHSVIELLMQQTARMDRTEASLQLYRATSDDDNIRFAAVTLASLNTGLLRLEDLVRDNPSQTAHARAFAKALEALSEAVDKAPESKAVSNAEIRECRNTLNLMLNEERGLLEQRTEESERTLLQSYVSETVYVALSLGLLVAVFGALLRDAWRRKAAQHQLSLANSSLSVSVETMRVRVSEAALLKNARDELQLCINALQAYQCLAHHMESAVPGSSGATMIINNSRSMLVSMSTWNQPTAILDGFDGSACCGLRAGRPRWRRPGESEIHCGHFVGTPPEHYLCIPLAALGDTLGFLYMSLPTEETVKIAEARLMVVYELVEVAAMAMAGLNLRAKLENQSIRDGLTNLFNRHFMEVALERELQRSTRARSSVALVMLDVDHFKDFNDTYGHEAGDLVLKELAKCLEGAVRGEDIVCRYGGEEFVVILPDMCEETAVQRAEVIRESASRIRLQFRGESMRQISISAGVAVYPNPAKDAVELLRIADRALYQAKRAGRNQVQVLAA